MLRLLPEKIECLVSVYKAGALSRIGHDVQLRFESLSLTVGDDLAMQAEFQVGSLRVVGALDGGRIRPEKLSPKDRRDIADNLAKVLEPARFPVAKFSSTSAEDQGDGYRIQGELTLHGVTRTIVVRARRAEGMATATVVLQQPDFAIKPFKALFGALKIRPDVKVEIRVPFEEI